MNINWHLIIEANTLLIINCERDSVLVSDFRENLVSVSSLDKDTQYSTLESKWEVLSAPPAPAAPEVEVNSGIDVPHSLSQQKLTVPVARSRPQSFAQKLRSTSKSVKGKLGLYFFMISCEKERKG